MSFTATHTLDGRPVMHEAGCRFRDAAGNTYSVNGKGVRHKVVRIAAPRTIPAEPIPDRRPGKRVQVPSHVYGLAVQAMSPHGPGYAQDVYGNVAARETWNTCRVSFNKGNMSENLGQDHWIITLPVVVECDGEPYTGGQ